MFNKPILTLLHIIALTVMFCQSEVTESAIVRAESIFKELGFSRECVSSLLGTQATAQNLRTVQKRRPRNCADLLKEGDIVSGVRVVYPFSCCGENRPVSVWCDQRSDGGGWTVIQHREDRPIREDFFRTWIEYEIGFGNLSAEFWLGLDNILALVSETLMELRVDLEDFEGEKRWAKYEHFHVGDAATKFKLGLGKYSGDAGDSLGPHSGHKFSTHDQDNDTHDTNCAQKHEGAWWYNYNNCHESNLNGFQHKGNHSSANGIINWDAFRGSKYSLKTTTMALRPKFRQ